MKRAMDRREEGLFQERVVVKRAMDRLDLQRGEE